MTASDGTDVTTHELVPGISEVSGKVAHIILEVLSEGAVSRIFKQREVSSQHNCIRRCASVSGVGRSTRHPLRVSPRAILLHPVPTKQILKEDIGPLSGSDGPRTLKLRSGGIETLAVATETRPGIFRLLHRVGARTQCASGVALSKRMSTSNQRHGLGVIHSHAGENISDIFHQVGRLGDTHVTLGVHIDKTNSGGTQGLLAVPIHFAGVEPLLLLGGAEGQRVFTTIIIDTTGTEAKVGSSHVLDSNGASESDQISPGETFAILLLDRPQQV
mmetsp:Transcript_22609/g.38282  ORF Transcript_22609/g.38282 Transcript_22609/m.38282 type:complete len:274 (-) Transcript_22609:500-1321(-)